MNLKEHLLSEETIYAGRVLRLTKATVRVPDGTVASREIVHTTGAAGILVLNEGNQALFVNQWRTPLNQLTLEIPAGKIEPRETPLAAAKRELNEEGSLRAARWAPLTTYYQAAGFSDAQTHLFVARGLSAPSVQRQLDQGEFLDQQWLTQEEARQAQQEGAICDAKTVLALALWANLGSDDHA